MAGLCKGEMIMTTGIAKKEIATFTYSGSDDMIDLRVKRIPPCPPVFKATLKLKNGQEIDAPEPWRARIWKWWYIARKGERIEMENELLVQVARQMAPPKGRVMQSYRGDR